MSALTNSQVQHEVRSRLHRHEAYLLKLLLRRRLQEASGWLLTAARAGRSVFRQGSLVQRVGPGRPPRAKHEWDGSRLSPPWMNRIV